MQTPSEIQAQQILPSSGSICYSATMPNKKVNEDAHIHFKHNGLTLFAVADGLGSYAAAAEASGQVIGHIRENANGITTDSAFLNRFFQDMNNRLRRIAQSDAYKKQHPEKLLGTTLILGIESKDKVTFAYIGNGAIIHIRGTIGEFGEKDDPWFATNLLNPHTVPENGVDVMYRLLSNDGTTPVRPTVITVDKDSEEGDVFIICTDGIASHDHVELFRHAAIGLLSKYNGYLLELFAGLKEFQRSGKEDTSNRLECMITSFMEKNRGTFTDDATLAVLITENFIKSK